MIVIDTSSLIKYLLKEEGWENVSEFLRNSEDLVSLEMALIEGANAVWKRYNLYRDISIETTRRILDYLHATKGIIRYENPLQYLSEGEKIALEHKITVYDALYIAQAIKYEKLATSDDKQGEIAKKLGVEVFYL